MAHPQQLGTCACRINALGCATWVEHGITKRSPAGRLLALSSPSPPQPGRVRSRRKDVRSVRSFEGGERRLDELSYYDVCFRGFQGVILEGMFTNPDGSVAGRKVKNYYEPFYGHDPEHLALALAALRRRHDSVVFLAGDSSLDNKYWFSSWAEALHGYEDVLEPAVMKRDVCYWVNEEAAREGKSIGCLNAAVEATSLNDRSFGRLLPQDAFIRDAIDANDVLVVSVGGNDVALQPLLCTAVNLALLVCCTPRVCLERCACASPPNLGVDCGCCGCGAPGCVAGLAGWPPGFGYVVDLFKAGSTGRGRSAALGIVDGFVDASCPPNDERDARRT